MNPALVVFMSFMDGFQDTGDPPSTPLPFYVRYHSSDPSYPFTHVSVTAGVSLVVQESLANAKVNARQHCVVRSH